MPLHDLTPQLRTRLSAVERAVGWFVILATVILAGGFAFYIYQAGQTKGWFVTKVNYATSLESAAGLKVGDPVTFVGFNVGEITKIEANEPGTRWGVTVFFWIKDPYYGYIWLDSKVRENSDFLGHSSLEILKGRDGAATAFKDHDTLMIVRRYATWVKFKELQKQIKAGDTNRTDAAVLELATNQVNGLIRSNIPTYYVSMSEGKFNKPIDAAITNWCWIPPIDSTPLADRMAAVAANIESALPNILGMTNKINTVLTNADAAVSRLNRTLDDAHPTLTNIAFITSNLRDPNGSLGNWLIPTNLSAQLRDALTNASATLSVARSTLDNADTNLTSIAADLDHTLEHLSDLTSNLAWQASINTNLVTDIDSTIVHTDDLIQGLKRHWLLRSAFKQKPTNRVEHREPPVSPARK